MFSTFNAFFFQKIIKENANTKITEYFNHSPKDYKAK